MMGIESALKMESHQFPIWNKRAPNSGIIRRPTGILERFWILALDQVVQMVMDTVQGESLTLIERVEPECSDQ
jgi:hypothetical protein